MSSIVTALEADDHVGAACEPVDDLALAFVAPLRADDRYVAQFESLCVEAGALLRTERRGVQLKSLERPRSGAVRHPRGLPMKPMTEQHLAIYRRHMVEIIDMHFDLSGDEIGTDVLDHELRRALMDVPRH